DAALMRLSADGVIRVTPASTCADFNKPETGVALFSSPSTKDYGYLHNRRLGVMGEAPAGRVSTEIALAGGQPVVLSFTRNWVERGTGYVCQVHHSLVPEPGVHYQLEASPVFAEGKCLVAVSRLSEPAALVVTEPAKLCGAPR
ncbi:MAG: hypothetical protein RL722_984, partial [Pseudomonadota bacterium]